MCFFKDLLTDITFFIIIFHILYDFVCVFQKFEALYNAQAQRGHVDEKTQFDYSWCLIRSRYTSDMHKGIALLEGISPSNGDACVTTSFVEIVEKFI